MTFLKSMILAMVLTLTPNAFPQLSKTDLPKEIQVPKFLNQNIQTDGIFSAGEWEAAKEYKLNDGYSLFFIADSDYLYTALKFPEPMGECVMELRISPEGKKVYVLHVSGDLGEGVADFPQNPGFEVGIHKNWESNPAKIDSLGRQVWIDAGQPMERYDEMYIPREGIEFRISRDMLSGDIPRIQVGWIRVDVKEGEIIKKSYSYPLTAGLKNSEHWSSLTFSEMNTQEAEVSKLTGPYYGEQLPKNEPLIFADGIISSGSDHCSATFSPDGNEIFWEMGEKIGYARLKNGYWTKPEILSFCKEDSYQYGNPFITPDGEKLFFTSLRPGAVSSDKENIWYSNRTSSGWTDPTPVSNVVNALGIHWSISVSDKGTLYFPGRVNGKSEESGIHYSKMVDGVHTNPVRMGPEINAQHNETCPYISPDESYILFNRFDPNDDDNCGIFISFKDKSDKWMPAVRVIGGAPDKGGMSPKITPDSRFLFFVNSGMWWMPAEIAMRHRPKE